MEDLPVLQITGSDANTPCVDSSIYTADTDEEEDDFKMPLLQMKQVKAEDHMSDYKSSSTEEFDIDSQD